VRRLVPNPAPYRAPVRVRHLVLDQAGRLVLRPVLRLAVGLVLVRVLDLSPSPVLVRFVSADGQAEETQLGPPQPVP
jgi:hypothetical protein